MHRFFRKLKILIRGDKFNRELEEEMAFHRTEAEKSLRAEGMASEDARHAANRRFGDETRLRDESRETVGFWFENLLQDFRFACGVPGLVTGHVEGKAVFGEGVDSPCSRYFCYMSG